MQYNFTKLAIASLLLIIISGCKKAELEPLTSTGFVQFKLERLERRFDDYNQKTGEIIPHAGLNYFTISFTSSVTKIINQSFYLQTISSVPLELKKYTFNKSNTKDRVYFTVVDTDLNKYVYTTRSSGTIEITRLDTVSGGKVEGTFSFTGLEYQDRNNMLLYTDRRLTDGLFSVTLK